jgi:hypothetical protein
MCANRSVIANVVLGEGAVGECQQEFAAVGRQALNRMRNTGRKEPQITGLDVIDEIMAVLIDGSDASLAGDHERPLRLLVPMQLANTAGSEPHVDPRDLLGDRHFADGDFA